MKWNMFNNTKDYDVGYVDGSAFERKRIIDVMTKLIDSKHGLESTTALLRQVRDTLEAHKP